MPGFNRTGPTGVGPMTGGGRGMCITDDRELTERFIRGAIGFGRGLGRGRHAAARARGVGPGFGHGRSR